MVLRMRTKPAFFENFNFFIVVILLIAYTKLAVGVTSGGAGDTTMKLIRCRENERQAIIDFKKGIVDDHGVLSSWGQSQEEEDCYKWRGGCVTTIPVV